MRHSILLATLAVAGALALLLAGCGATGAGEKSGAKGGTPPAQPGKGKRTYPVRVMKVAPQPVTYELQAVGSVEANDSYKIDARVPGTIYDVGFKEGDQVTPNDVLCRIAPEAYKLHALKAEGLYRQAVANLEDSKRRLANAIERTRIKRVEANVELARRKSVKEAGAISEEEIQLFASRLELAKVEEKDAQEAAQTEIKVLEAAVVEKEAAWKVSLDDVRKSTVSPPISGIIERKFVTNMMFVTAGHQVAQIVDTSTLKLRFKIPEKDAAAVQEGTKVSFSVPAHAGRTFEAQIYHIAAQLDTAARVIDCWAKVTADKALLKPGYYASVRIVKKVNKDAIVVPVIATQPTERGFVAFVIKGDVAQRRILTIGLTVTDDSVEVLDGLQAGEELVIEGANALQNGSAVKILTGPSPLLQMPNLLPPPKESTTQQRSNEKSSPESK